MYKVGILALAISSVSLPCATAPSNWRIDDASTERRVCNLRFERVPGLVVEVRKILEAERNSRVNNERYNACPYWVKARIGPLSIPIEFSEEFALLNLKKLDRYIVTGSMSFEDGQWRPSRPHPDSRDDVIHVSETVNDHAAVGVIHEYVESNKTSRFCYSLVVVNKNGYAVGGTCAKNKSTIVQALGDWIAKPLARFD